MARRGENIRLRVDGRWEARAIITLPGSNKRTYKYFYGRSYPEVKQKRLDFARECAVKAPVAPDSQPAKAPAMSAETISELAVPCASVTFEEVTRKWLTAKRFLVKESTYAHYAVQAKKHLLPELGLLPISELDAAALEDFINQKLESGGLLENRPLAPSTVSNLKVILGQILKYAKNKGMIETVPEFPTVPCSQKPIRVLTAEEQEMLLDQVFLEDTAFILGILIALYAGLRIGEVCALQWGDLDFVSGTVTVRKTVMRIYDMSEDAAAKTKAFVDTPKTACSSRTVPLTDDMAHYLFKRKKSDEIYVITGSEKFMEPRVCLDRYKRLLHRAGLPDYNFHLLRHTFATRCVEKGVDYKSLSEFLGHSNVSITMQRYVHPSMELKKKQINKLTGFGIRGQN